MTARPADRWGTTTFGRLARIGNGADYSSVEVEAGGYPVYGSGGEFRRASSYLFDGESVLFGRKGTVDRPLYVDGKFWTVDTMFYSVIDRSRLLPRFAYYWATTLPFGAWATDTALPSMTSTAIKAAPIALPSVPEQRAIADYLDRETAQIDAFIAKNEELITLLTERRASVLRAAMGEGSSQMRLRQVLTVAQTGPFGTQLSASEYIDDGVPVINPSHIVAGVIAHDPGVSVSVERAGELSRFRLSPDDIVLGRKGEVDKAALVDEESDGYLCGSDSMMLRPSKSTVHPKYLWWFLQSPPAHEQLERFAVGSTVVGLNQRTLRLVQLPVPSLEEQKAISADLNRATAAIGSAMSVAKRSVELARERRAALISAAVTGKIDVGVAV